MEQHPVPQHIASFEFKLFGNLTIRQFFTLAVPMTIALAIFFAPGTSIIRIPFALFFAGTGLIVALVPIGGRPFDKWIVAFARAVLSPTQRVWVKEAKIPQFLDILINEPKAAKDTTEPITFQDRQKLNTYLRSLPRATVSPLDVKEQVDIENLGLSLQTASEPFIIEGKLPPPIIWTTTSQTTPLKKEAPSFSQQTALPQVTPLPRIQTEAKISPHAKPFALTGLAKKLTTRQILVSPKINLAGSANFSIENVIRVPGKRVRLLHGLTKTRTRKLHFAPPINFNLTNLPVRGEARFEISEELKRRFRFENPTTGPEEVKIAVAPQAAAAPKTKSAPKQGNFMPKAPSVHFSGQNATLKPEEQEMADSQISVRGEMVNASKPAAILQKAQIVPLTNTPNVLSGLVCDATGIPLEGAIITVRDKSGIPVRALKTNKLGQFLSITPLTSGVYSLEIEHENANFEPISLNLSGQILSPVVINAKGGFA